MGMPGRELADYTCPHGCCVVGIEGGLNRARRVQYGNETFNSIAELAGALEMSNRTVRDRMLKRACIVAPLQMKPRPYDPDKQTTEETRAEQFRLCNQFLSRQG